MLNYRLILLQCIRLPSSFTKWSRQVHDLAGGMSIIAWGKRNTILPKKRHHDYSNFISIDCLLSTSSVFVLKQNYNYYISTKAFTILIKGFISS